MDLDTDVAVLGGGPAGASAALGLAARGVEVTVLHTPEHAHPRTVETLAPVAKPLLEQVGVWSALPGDGHQPVYGSRSKWGAEAVKETSYVFHPHGHGWRLDRTRFDDRLRRCARDRGARWHGDVRVTQVDKTARGWDLQWRQNGHGGTMKARYLIDATGRNAWLAHRRGAKRWHRDRLIAFSGRVSIEGPAGQAATLVEAVEHGWWYSIDMPATQQREVVFFTDYDLPAARRAATREGWMELLRQTGETSAGVVSDSLQGKPKALSSRTGVLDKPAEDGWLAVGDAALTSDPLASNGLVTALKSGLEAAAVVSDQIRNPSRRGEQGYARRVAMNHQAGLTLQIAYYRMEPRWRSSPFWMRRQAVDAHLAAAER